MCSGRRRYRRALNSTLSSLSSFYNAVTRSAICFRCSTRSPHSHVNRVSSNIFKRRLSNLCVDERSQSEAKGFQPIYSTRTSAILQSERSLLLPQSGRRCRLQHGRGYDRSLRFSVRTRLYVKRNTRSDYRLYVHIFCLPEQRGSLQCRQIGLGWWRRHCVALL